jgi:hypothetical protein
VTTLRDEDITTTPTATMPGGDADGTDGASTQADPDGVDTSDADGTDGTDGGADADGTDGGDADGSDS